MKPVKEDRVFLRKDLVVVFKETVRIGSKMILLDRTAFIDKRIIFVDDFVIFEPANLFEGGRKSEFIANISTKITTKHILVKSKYVEVFNEVLTHYLKLTGQKYKQTLLKQFVLLKNNVILLKLGKCCLKDFPKNLSIDLKAIKARLDAKYGRTTDPSITKVIVRGKVKQIKK